ncbi:hypothetical protein IAT38_004301 [Cryptococcus sp. DSM 104549]
MSVYRSLQRFAHEKPIIMWSLIVGFSGPLMVLVVPPVRKSLFGYKIPEPIPKTYPLPNRPREAVTGYED